MKFKSLILATLVLGALTGTLYWSDHRKPTDNTASASTATSPAILKLDSASITKLEMKNKDSEPIVLAKDSSGTWEITQPKAMPADQSVISGTLSSLSSLSSERLVEDKPADLKPFGLDSPAFELDITERDNHSQKLLLGDQTPTGSAIYAMLAGDPRLFTIPSYTKTSIDKSVNDLRDKRLITIDADKISLIDLTGKNQEIEFGRSKDEWQFLKPKTLRADDNEVGELARKLADARMEISDSGDKANDASSAFARGTPVATAKITGPSGTQELQLRKDKDKDKNTDTYYAKSSVVEGAYKVDNVLGAALDKGIDDFRNKKLFDFAFNDPDKIEMHSGSKAYYLVKGGSDWWSNGKKMDAETAQSFISQLRDLSAAKFVDSGFTTPTIDLTVTSDDGKRVEKVAIAKVADHYIARRENDPTLYQIEAFSIDALQKSADDVKPAAVSTK
jgi:hypothetical protein